MTTKKNKKSLDAADQFGDRLKIAMGKMSVSKLCKTTGLSDTSIYNYLGNTALPRVDKARDLADALDVSFLWLTLGEGKQEARRGKNADIFAPENLKELHVDLLTMTEAVEEVLTKAKKRKQDIDPKKLAQDIALKCMGIEKS
ncbi:MAG: helix-turn-helix domain-containing protein [Alphaproteobacteria bacterium]|nr:helix-turn-helix domain-containing protein [Alphaproteobacteria bacterium]